jgi:hypothetical protein
MCNLQLVALPYGLGRLGKFAPFTFIVGGQVLCLFLFLFLARRVRDCGRPFNSRKTVEDGIRSVQVMDIGDLGCKN